MKISVITPAFNSCSTLQRAIESVLAQDYQELEHIVVDGGSTDGTVALLERYDHVRWISEPDNGQVDAMLKGFAMSDGEIIGNLNADDHYLPGAFSAVVREFERDADFVVGKVEVQSEHNGTTWINDPEVDLPSMLKHWLPNAFCVNPVGYFYRRHIQEAVPFNRDNDDKQDLEFLLEAASRCQFRKIDATLGVFAHVMNAKTFRNQLRPSYWSIENFPFVERVLSRMDPEYQRRFRLQRERGYQLRRQWTIQQAATLGLAQGLYEDGEIMLLPQVHDGHLESRDGFVEFRVPASPSDSILVILGPSETHTGAVYRALKSAPKDELPMPIYRTREIHASGIEPLPAFGSPRCQHASIARSLRHVLRHRRKDIRWKVVIGIRDPIALGLAQALGDDCSRQKMGPATLDYARSFVNDFFRLNCLEPLGVDVFAQSFDAGAGWATYDGEGVSVLVYRCEDLPRVLSVAMESFLGLAHVHLGEDEAGPHRGGEDARLLLDRAAVREIYESRLVRHFYTPSELRESYEKWQ